MNTEPTDNWDGTIRHPFFEWTQVGLGGQLGLRPERLLQGIDHVCGLMGMKIIRTPAGEHYNGVACETVVLHYDSWEIHVVDADDKDIPMPTTIQGCEATPVLPAVFFLGVYTTQPLPVGEAREQEIAGFRLMLIGSARARGTTARQRNPSSLRHTLRVQLSPDFERLTQ